MKVQDLGLELEDVKQADIWVACLAVG